MKRAALAGPVLVAGLHLLSCRGHEEVQLHSQLTYYVATQEALASDDFDRAGTALESLAHHAEGKLKSLAAKAAVAPDIGAMRDHFKPLSQDYLVREIPTGHRLAYCPMADNSRGAHWVQKDGQIMNPYFGASMLHCGVFAESP